MHDIIKFKIITDSKVNLLKDINFFLSYFETDNVSSPDIILKIGKFEPSNEGCFLVDHKYYIKDNYFYCKDQEGRAKWEVEIFGFEEGQAMINFHGRVLGLEQVLIPDYLAQNLILRPLIELKLLERGYTVIHGLGIEKKGDAYIFAARGGAHKTRLAMDAIRCGKYRLIGDDRILLGKDRQVLSYPLFYNLVMFRAERLRDEHISSFLDKVKMARYISSRHNRKNTNKIFADRSKLKKMFLVARKEGYDNISQRRINLDDAVIRLVRSNQMEMTSSGISSLGFVHFLKYMLAYCYVFPESEIGGYWGDLRYSLKETLIDLPLYEIELPYKYTQSILINLANSYDGGGIINEII